MVFGQLQVESFQTLTERRTSMDVFVCIFYILKIKPYIALHVLVMFEYIVIRNSCTAAGLRVHPIRPGARRTHGIGNANAGMGIERAPRRYMYGILYDSNDS